MKYVNRYDSVADAVAAQGNFSPNITHVAGSTNPNQLVITALGDNKPIHFVDRGGGFIEGATEPCKIIYTAETKLSNSKYDVGATFCGATITKHDFSNGNGVIEFDNDITEIENSGCFGLSSVTSFILPNTITSIGGSAFNNCSSMTSINIPDSVTSIGGSAFYYCIGLTAIMIPSSVTSIGGSAFTGCTGLVSITIPSSVTSIDMSAFEECTGFASITIDENNTIYDSRNNCNAIIETTSNELKFGCKNTIIPDSVTSIGGSAFTGCTGLVSITIPNSVTSIGGSAFTGCTGLVSITIPNSVTSIGMVAFVGCPSLTELTLPESIESIGGGMCNGDTNMTVTCLPTSIPEITDSYIGHPFANVKKVLVPASSLESYKTAWPEVANKIEAIA